MKPATLLAIPEKRTALDVLHLGLIDYQSTWELQKNLQQQLIAGKIVDTLILCQHKPVFTIGRSGSANNLLCAVEELPARGIEYYEIERGGDITYHGPGQLVAYPIINLNNKRRDVAWYMRMLEEVVIMTLATYNINGLRYSGRTGVWTQPLENAIDSAQNIATHRKIASIGVRLSRWCSMHGFALNVHDCSSGFELINPCGFSDVTMSCMQQASDKEIMIEEVETRILQIFCQLFNYQFV